MVASTRYFQNCLGVFEGGGVKGIAYVGAYREAIKRGVSFSEIVGASVGSIIAVMIAAGVTPEKLESIVRELDFNSFLNRPETLDGIGFNKYYKFGMQLILPKEYIPIYDKLGMYNSNKVEEFVENNLRDILGKNETIKFSHLKLPCSIVAADLKTGKAKIWGTKTTPDEDVAKAVRTSSNIPLFFQPVEKRYVDGGILSNLPTFLFNRVYSKISIKPI